jgi:hypothetical protein
MNCPYCVRRVHSDQPSIQRGRHLAHSICQTKQERQGSWYLTAHGGMWVGDQRHPRAEADVLVRTVEKLARAGVR